MADKTTSDKRIVRTAPVEVSVLSTLPPGLDEGKYRIAVEDDSNEEEVILLEVPPGAWDEGTTNLLDPPTEISIKSQTFRFAPDGSMVVDVVVSVGEVKGATNYELRSALEGA